MKKRNVFHSRQVKFRAISISRMSANNPNHNPDEPVAKFRLNIQVFQILALLGIALALPLTILVLGILDIRKNQKTTTEPAKVEIASEIPGLRQSLESIAEVQWPETTMDSEMRVFKLFIGNEDNGQKKRSEIIDFLTNQLGSVFLELQEPDKQCWIVTWDATKTEEFEKTLIAKGFISEKRGKGTNISSASLEKESGTGNKTIESISNRNASVFYKLYLESRK